LEGSLENYFWRVSLSLILSEPINLI
jgi:hypothetical protein